MTDDRDLFIVRFARDRAGVGGDPVDCTRVDELGGLATYPVREGVAAAEHGINVAVRAASETEAVSHARERADAYVRAHLTGV